MRYFIAASVLAAGALAQTATDYLQCVSAVLGSADPSTFEDCAGKNVQECFCDNKAALDALSESSASECTSVDISSLTDSLCSNSSEAAPARHASKPMELADAHMKRAFAPQAEAPASAANAVPRVVYVTETKTDCSCKSTSAPYAHMAHVSQIPVSVPASSSYMAGMAASSTPASYSHGLMGAASSSVLFGSQASAATPSPSGADPNRYSPFQGAAAPGASVHTGVAAVGVAAVMAFMAAL